MSRETLTPSPARARSASERLRLEIGIGLRDERRRRGLTLRRLAEAVGVDFTTIRNVEIGRPASLEVIERIASVLKLELSVNL